MRRYLESIRGSIFYYFYKQRYYLMGLPQPVLTYGVSKEDQGALCDRIYQLTDFRLHQLRTIGGSLATLNPLS